jgi:hypothetical protein
VEPPNIKCNRPLPLIYFVKMESRKLVIASKEGNTLKTIGDNKDKNNGSNTSININILMRILCLLFFSNLKIISRVLKVTKNMIKTKMEVRVFVNVYIVYIKPLISSKILHLITFKDKINNILKEYTRLLNALTFLNPNVFLTRPN